MQEQKTTERNQTAAAKKLSIATLEEHVRIAFQQRIKTLPPGFPLEDLAKIVERYLDHANPSGLD